MEPTRINFPSGAPILTLILLVLWPATFMALESDNNQPVTYSSDGVTRTRTEGNIRFLEMSTNVIVSQGSMQITGDTVVSQYNIETDELIKITVQGTPVRYYQIVDEDQNEVNGDSDTLEMYTDAVTGETIIELIGNANIQSPDLSMSCASITYVSDTELVQSPGPCKGALSATGN